MRDLAAASFAHQPHDVSRGSVVGDYVAGLVLQNRARSIPIQSSIVALVRDGDAKAIAMAHARALAFIAEHLGE